MRVTEFIIEKFEKAKHTKPISFTAYHWSEKPISSLSNRLTFYVCDDPESWASPWVKNKMYLYKMTVTFKRPYVVHKSITPYEYIGLNKDLARIKDAGYDGVIYTPGTGVMSIRQAVLLDPLSQITNMSLKAHQ